MSVKQSTRPAIGIEVRSIESLFAEFHAEPVSERPLSESARIYMLDPIAISTTLERLTDDVIIAGIAQGIVVVGWVALWPPAQRFAIDVIPHRFERGSYARLAELEIRFVWEDGNARRTNGEADREPNSNAEGSD